MRSGFLATGLLGAVLMLGACGRIGLTPDDGFVSPTPTGTPTPGPTPDPFLDGPLVVESILIPGGMLRPGQQNLGVRVRLDNPDPQVDSTNVRLTLTFREAGTAKLRDADFVAREEVWNGRVDANDTVDVDFRVDLTVGLAVTASVVVGAHVEYEHAGARSEDSAQTATWTFEPVREHLVNTTSDLGDGGGPTFLSLREAITNAGAMAGLDRIQFDPAIFPTSGTATITLADELPLVANGSETIVDGTRARVTLTPDVALNGSQKWIFRLEDPRSVIHGLRFLGAGRLYPAITGCSAEMNGGAILITTNSLDTLVSGNVFDDAATTKRDCYAPQIRVLLGTGHRIVDNDFIGPAGDAIVAYAGVAEISRNRITGARDDGMVLNRLTGATLIEGNLITDSTLSGILVVGLAGDGELDLRHNTFVRCGSAGIRRFGPRPQRERNNVFLSNSPAAHDLSDSGTNATIASTRAESNGLCNPACPGANVQNTSTGPLGFTNAAGTTWASFLPAAGSALIDDGQALDISDRNTSRAGRFVGSGPDTGAVESGL